MAQGQDTEAVRFCGVVELVFESRDELAADVAAGDRGRLRKLLNETTARITSDSKASTTAGASCS